MGLAILGNACLHFGVGGYRNEASNFIFRSDGVVSAYKTCGRTAELLLFIRARFYVAFGIPGRLGLAILWSRKARGEAMGIIT